MAVAVMSSTTTTTSIKNANLKLINNIVSVVSLPESTVDKNGKRIGFNPLFGRSKNKLIIEDVFSGTYEFQRYDDHLEDYLDSLGLAGRDLGRIVRQTPIKIELRMPRNVEEKWTLITHEQSKIHSKYRTTSVRAPSSISTPSRIVRTPSTRIV